MAEKLASLKQKGGGDLQETVLWTNPAPTSAFAGKNVNLSDNISNYKYISIRVRVNTSTPSYTDIFLDTTQFVNCVLGGGYPMAYLGYYASSTNFTRLYGYVSDTSVFINDCKYFSTGNVSTQNAAVIPVSISGWK